MLTDISIANFRCFSRLELPLKQRTFIVGRNNAGKSTLIEALRIVATVAERRDALAFVPPPKWSGLPVRQRGVAPSLKHIQISAESLFHEYSDPPATLSARFSTGHKIDVSLGPDAAPFATLTTADGRPVESKGHAAKLRMPSVAVLPAIGPLSRDEQRLKDEYVRASMQSHLAPQHFRNQLVLFRDRFNTFKALAEANWPGLRIRSLDVVETSAVAAKVTLMVQDGSFVSEIGWMGHGLQMWLQVIWFLARADNFTTLVLDEPDIYMHPDLQRRLVRLVRRLTNQTILTSHSTEILAEAAPEDILIIDKDRRKATFATSIPAVQRVVDHVGGVSNVQLSRLWSARKCILVEGKDIQLLKALQDIVFPDSSTPVDALPNMAIGGWDGWPYAVGTSMLMTNAVDNRIQVFCVLDRDYRSKEVTEKRLLEAKQKNIRLHVWKMKEIENYLVDASVIARLIHDRSAFESTPTADEVDAAIDAACDDLRSDTIRGLADEYHREHRSKGEVAGLAANHANEVWTHSEHRRSIVSGKALLSRMSQWAKQQADVSFSPIGLARAFRADEVPAEVRDLLAEIES